MGHRPKQLLAVVVGALVVLLAVVAPADRPASAAPPGQGSPVETRLVTVTTEDGAVLNGALYTPDADSRRTTAALVVHGNPGNFYGLVSTFLGQGLAAAGYQTLAINLRSHDHRYATSLFPDTAKDIRAGVDYLM